jgi:uncharacterized membrane protein
MSDAITPWIHILAVAVWLGPQFFLFLAAIPAIRTIEDATVRARVMRVTVTRFGWVAWAAMLVLVLTGISNLFQEGADAAIDLGSSDYRWFHIFTLKMTLVGITVVLTGVHTFLIGPRQLKLADQMDADPADAARLRRVSMIVSGLTLVITIAVVYVAALLANHEYSYQPT